MLRFLTYLLRSCLLAVPVGVAAVWSCYPALHTVWAVVTMPPHMLASSDWQDPVRNLTLRRQVQKHFLDHAVYIPLEDIAAGMMPAPLPSDDPSLLMQNACGQGKLLVWLPFKFILPITGEKVIEWCWKPQTKDV